MDVSFVYAKIVPVELIKMIEFVVAPNKIWVSFAQTKLVIEVVELKAPEKVRVRFEW